MPKVKCDKLIRKAKELYMIQFFEMEVVVPKSVIELIAEKVPPELVEALLKYLKVFTEPTTLPPARPCDHRIPLINGSQPLSRQLYRHVHYQKLVIEVTVRTTLNGGLIRESKNPYATPVLLVKKADRD